MIIKKLIKIIILDTCIERFFNSILRSFSFGQFHKDFHRLLSIAKQSVINSSYNEIQVETTINNNYNLLLDYYLQYNSIIREQDLIYFLSKIIVDCLWRSSPDPFDFVDMR